LAEVTKRTKPLHQNIVGKPLAILSLGPKAGAFPAFCSSELQIVNEWIHSPSGDIGVSMEVPVRAEQRTRIKIFSPSKCEVMLNGG
jgi:hypothetical protein